MGDLITKKVFLVLLSTLLGACSLNSPTIVPTVSGSSISSEAPKPIPSRTPTANRTATIDARHTDAAALAMTQNANLTASAVVRATTRALTPSRPPSQTPTDTPTLDFSEFADLWKRYTSEEYGLSFEYPAVYDEAPYSDAGCNVKSSTYADEVHFDIGGRVILAIFKANNQTLIEYVDRFVKDNEGQDFRITSRTERTIGGEKAIMLEYRFGSLNRYGVVTYFKRDDNIYGVDFTAGVFCEMVVGDTTSGMSEFDTYFHILDSFQFIR